MRSYYIMHAHALLGFRVSVYIALLIASCDYKAGLCHRYLGDNDNQEIPNVTHETYTLGLIPFTLMSLIILSQWYIYFVSHGSKENVFELV